MWRLAVHKNCTFQHHATQDRLPWDSVRLLDTYVHIVLGQNLSLHQLRQPDHMIFIDPARTIASVIILLFENKSISRKRNIKIFTRRLKLRF